MTTTVIYPMDNSSIERLLNGENVDVKEVPLFTNFDEAKPYLIALGKAARKISDERKSFFMEMAMHEVEEAWYKALHADCGFVVFNAAQMAFGWLKKMVEFKTTGKIAL